MSAQATMPALIYKVRELAADVREFTLVPGEGREFPVYSAGSHVVVGLPLGARTQRNAYSLLGDPAQRDRWRIAVRRQQPSRGGSAWLHDEARPGLRLELSAPLNLFALVRTARHHVLVAGGIGITPILSMARELARLGASFEVHYACRGVDNAVFSDELEPLAGGRLNLHDSERSGRLDFDALLARQSLGSHLYICGPQGMVEDCMQAGARQGWPASHLHSEQFLAPPHGLPFEVELALSKKRFTVPADLSLLEAIEQQGIEAPSLCRGGACGQCELEVLDTTGTLIHHDLCLSREDRAAGRKLMPCVSRLDRGCVVLKL
ncbi:PDR/VanB family oxidoreductase [Methylibium sp.]|uniref:PDR/VanB family oxidoreductase n=1 Tax=Methylibium sp. TaxID=2067992 RepID=UPI0025DDF801|nr:PDR/VanB family oxidoreductase [Methylibium sp.]